MIFIIIILFLLAVIVLPWRQERKDQRRSALSSSTPTSSKSTTTQLTPLVYPRDYEQYTVRINTWKRNEHLELSIRHHMTCERVAAIQIVWCIEQGEPPDWLLQLAAADDDDENHTNNTTVTKPVLILERHGLNSLNERFRILNDIATDSDSPIIHTAGILSIDDDIIRPCLALEQGFVLWTRNPDRQVGFDARSHEIITSTNNNTDATSSTTLVWKYAYMSTTERTNRYSITLTRCSFLHRDYMTSYMYQMPESIRDFVTTHMNCEDIAMSFWISHLTQNQPPLLADYWAVKSQIKMYVGNDKISGGSHHKSIRDRCVLQFAQTLQLMHRLPLVTLYHGSYFQYGIQPTHWNQPSPPPPPPPHSNKPIRYAVEDMVQRWKQQQQHNNSSGETPEWIHELVSMRAEAAQPMYERGFVEHSDPWKRRFHTSSSSSTTIGKQT
jgi:glucuronyl/N-acetylglucosaminyl transferase EXT2